MGIQPDDLDSKQVARIVDLLSEGEIDGFPSARALSKTSTGYNVAALKDIFFNDTPLLSSETVVGADTSLRDVSSALNFDFVNGIFEPRFGTQDQKHLSSIGVTNQRTIPVNVEIPKPTNPSDEIFDRTPGAPVTRQITDTDVTSVRVVVGTPALQVARDDGDIDGGIDRDWETFHR